MKAVVAIVLFIIYAVVAAIACLMECYNLLFCFRVGQKTNHPSIKETSTGLQIRMVQKISNDYHGRVMEPDKLNFSISLHHYITDC
jgi:hypothetical protein